jgi:hypothetical protein
MLLRGNHLDISPQKEHPESNGLGLMSVGAGWRTHSANVQCYGAQIGTNLRIRQRARTCPR